MKLLVVIAAVLLTLPRTLLAAEVINLTVGQSGATGFATFDLPGEIGEREAEVLVTLTIDGKQYSADKLTLKGDLGQKVKTGRGKRIEWDVLADISTGFDGEVIWDVTTASAAPPPPRVKKAVQEVKPVIKSVAPPGSTDKALPFDVAEKTIRDRNTGYIWLRDLEKNAKRTDFNKATSFVVNLAEERFAGCRYWQLPLEADLQKLRSYAVAAGYTGKRGKGYPADYLNAVGFSGITNDYYWIMFDTKNFVSFTVRTALDLEDGSFSNKEILDHLQVWPVCKPN